MQISTTRPDLQPDTQLHHQLLRPNLFTSIFIPSCLDYPNLTMKSNANTNKSSQATPGADHVPRVLHARPKIIQNGPSETQSTEMADHDAENKNRSNLCPYLSMHPSLRKSLADFHPDRKPTLWKRSKHTARNFLKKWKWFKQRKDLSMSSKAGNNQTMPEHEPMCHTWFICAVCRQPTPKHAVENGNLGPSPNGRMCDGCAGELLAERELS